MKVRIKVPGRDGGRRYPKLIIICVGTIIPHSLMTKPYLIEAASF